MAVLVENGVPRRRARHHCPTVRDEAADDTARSRLETSAQAVADRPHSVADLALLPATLSEPHMAMMGSFTKETDHAQVHSGARRNERRSPACGADTRGRTGPSLPTPLLP